MYIFLPDFTITQVLGEGDQRGYQALFTVNEMVNLCDPTNPSSFSSARNLAQNFFNQRNGQSQHIVHAMGHCHIDTGFYPLYYCPLISGDAGKSEEDYT